MAAAAVRMEQTMRTVESEKKQVEAAVTQLFGSFTGDAATEFGRAMTGWYGNVDAINRALKEMIDIMRGGEELVQRTHVETQTDAEQSTRSMLATYGGLNGL